MAGNLVSSYLLDYVRNNRIYTQPTRNVDPFELLDEPRDAKTPITNSAFHLFSTSSCDAVRTIGLSSVAKSQLSGPSDSATCCCPKPTSGSTWRPTTSRIRCTCSCRRCKLNEQLSRVYGIVITCANYYPTLDFDLALFNGQSKIDHGTGLLKMERYLVECIKILNYIPSEAVELKTFEFRHFVLKHRNILTECGVFSPVVSADLITTCYTCNCVDDGTIQGCQCRRIYFNGDLSFDDDVLLDLRIDYHCLDSNFSSSKLLEHLFKIFSREFRTNRIVCFLLKTSCSKHTYKFCLWGFHQQSRPPDHVGNLWQDICP